MRHLLIIIMFPAVLMGCGILESRTKTVSDPFETVVRAQGPQEPVPDEVSLPHPMPDSNDPANGVPSENQQDQQLAPRPLTIYEAISRAIDRSDVVRTLSGGVRIERINGFDPMIADAQYRSQITIFDPRFSAEYEGSQINRPPSSFFGPGLLARTRRDEGNFIASLEKSWPLGTTTRIAYDPSLGYLFFPNGADPDEYNPAYSSQLVFEVRQPLLRGGGKTVNLAPIRIARTRVDQSYWEVQEQLQAQVRSIEEAYWELQAAHLTLKSLEEVIPLAAETVRIQELRFEAERTIYADVARAKVALEALQRRKLQAVQDVRVREYQLRQLINMPVEDGTYFVLVDPPRQAYPNVNADLVLATALERRPDLLRRRLEVQLRQIDLDATRNSLNPRLDVIGAYRTSGLQGALDDSLRQMNQFKYTDWTLGAAFSVPLGNRQAKANTLQRELEVSKEQALLFEYENQVSYQVAELITQVQTAWGRFQSAMRQSRHTQEWMKLSRVRFSAPPASGRGQDSLLIALYDYQQAMESYVNSISTAAETLAEYNVLLARLDEEQGTLLERWHVELASAAYQQQQQQSYSFQNGGHTIVAGQGEHALTTSEQESSPMMSPDASPELQLPSSRISDEEMATPSNTEQTSAAQQDEQAELVPSFGHSIQPKVKRATYDDETKSSHNPIKLETIQVVDEPISN